MTPCDDSSRRTTATHTQTQGVGAVNGTLVDAAPWCGADHAAHGASPEGRLALSLGLEAPPTCWTQVDETRGWGRVDNCTVFQDSIPAF